MKIKKEMYKLRCFAVDSVLILQEPQNSTEHLKKKWKDIGILAGLKVSKQKNPKNVG